jgi:hypothetical protein
MVWKPGCKPIEYAPSSVGLQLSSNCKFLFFFKRVKAGLRSRCDPVPRFLGHFPILLLSLRSGKSYRNGRYRLLIAYSCAVGLRVAAPL